MSDADDAAGPPGDTREVLLQATFTALCRHGYADLTLRKIAAESGKSRGLVHYHYDSKDHLIVALLEHLSNRFVDRIEDTNDEPPAERLDRLLRWLVVGPSTEDVNGRDYHKAIFELRAQAPYNEAIRAQLEENFGVTRDICEGIIRDGIRQGVFRPVDVDVTTGVILHAVASARDTELTLEDEEAVGTVLEALDQFVFPQLYTASAGERPE